MLTPEQRSKIEEFARQGVQKAEIARRLRVSRSTVHRVLAGEASPALDAPVYTLAMMSQILRRALSKETCSECGATFYRPLAVPELMCPGLRRALPRCAPERARVRPCGVPVWRRRGSR